MKYKPNLTVSQPDSKESSLTFISSHSLLSVEFDTTDIVFLCILIVLPVVILIANMFATFVFWIHRKKLKRTFLLAINLAFADLFVGFTGILTVIAVFAFPRHTGFNKIIYYTFFAISLILYSTFSCLSVYFLVLISLERAFALIWPLRHRVASIKVYIYSVVIVWLAGATQGALGFLVLYHAIKIEYSEVTGGVMIYFSVATICVSYLSIRKRLNNRNRDISTAQNRQCVEQNIKLSKTFFAVIIASIVLWAPSMSFYIVSRFHPNLFAGFSKYIFVMLNQSNSLVNPIIYSFRMPIFRKTLGQLKNRMKLQRPSRRYTVDGEAWNLCQARKKNCSTIVQPSSTRNLTHKKTEAILTILNATLKPEFNVKHLMHL